MQGQKKITLPKRYRVANENANSANQALVDYYNALCEIGIAYDNSLHPHGNKDDSKAARRVLTKNFKALLVKATQQRVVVVNLGAAPFPFPLKVYNSLPQHFKVKKRGKKHFNF